MSGAARHFWCGQQGQRRRQRESLETAAQEFLCGLQSPEVEQTAVEAIADVDSIVTIKAFHGLFEHHTEEDAEHSWCQDLFSRLFHAVDNWKGFREVAI